MNKESKCWTIVCVGYIEEEMIRSDRMHDENHTQISYKKMR